MKKARTPRQTARVKKQKPGTSLVVTVSRELSSNAQEIYNNLVDIREDHAKAREKRQNALMQNPKYAGLKREAQSIVKEASAITKQFDQQHPNYKKDIDGLAEDGKKAMSGLTRIAIEAMRKGVELEVYQGSGKARKRVKFATSLQLSLF